MHNWRFGQSEGCWCRHRSFCMGLKALVVEGAQPCLGGCAEPSVSDVAKFAENELDNPDAAGVAEEGDEEDNWPTSWEAIRSKNGGGGGGGGGGSGGGGSGGVGSGGSGTVADEVAAQPHLSESELQDFADAHGFGRLYATFGGSHDGLEACAAGACYLLHTSGTDIMRQQAGNRAPSDLQLSRAKLSHYWDIW